VGATGPEQKPETHELVAHWASVVQVAWKLPQWGISMLFTA
jgi:hypothetical protein